jgi:hypothetical protein
MPRSEKVEEVLGKAETLEKSYDWVKAVALHKQALRAVGKGDFLKKGEIQEKIGYCFHRAAFQAESQEEFKERMRRAIKAYEKAGGFYEKLADEQKAARMFRCDAVAKYLGYWLTSNPSEKRKLLDECLEFEGKALAGFLECGNMLEYGRLYNELPLVFLGRVYLEWDLEKSKGIMKTGFDWGQKAIAALSELGDSYETAKTYLTFAILSGQMGIGIVDPEEQEKNRLRVEKYLTKANELFMEIGDAFLVGWAHLLLGVVAAGEESLRHFEKTLECGRQTRDNLLSALSLDMLAYLIYWEAVATEDPEKRRILAEKAIQLHEKAQHHYLIMSLIFPGALINHAAGHAEHYLHLFRWETDPKKRRALLKKAEKVGVEALKIAEDSDAPFVIHIVFHVVSKVLVARAQTETDIVEKRSRLEKALKYRERALDIQERLDPFDYWNRGAMQSGLAAIKTELANIEPNFDIKRRLLEEAAARREECLKLWDKKVPYLERLQITILENVRSFLDTYATLLTQLYNLTRKSEYLRRTIELSQKAIESANKLDMTSRIAESYWKIAKAQDTLGEHLKAAESFKHASESYMKATEKIPKLGQFYQDYASYMQAWCEIEKAKHHHTKSQYGQAKKQYENAANFSKSAKPWNYLSPNCMAWARLEEAEDLSRREQSEEARDLFQQAAKLFLEAKDLIDAKLEKIEVRDEKDLATELAQASSVREEYCVGRIALEEAKILDRQGDHAGSSRKYGSAAEKFQKATEAMEHESDRQELKPIVSLCRAWQMMTRAEAEASPDLYLEASKLFNEAKEESFDEKAKVLALGHSSFCKALEAGTRFEATRDKKLYSTAKKHLEAAANYYVRAGFKNALEYARATHRFFDAYIYLHKAETETDPRKKTQYYKMAEKFLQTSAGSYLKAKHPEKSEEVGRLLDSVKEERKFVMSLAEVLHAPTITSTTTSFSTPTPTHEQAVGLERFEHADIQASLILRVRDVKVGENIDLEIELVNAGKAPALLIKVEEIIPKDFEIKRAPQTYRVEDRYLNMKGKKLAPLKTEEIRLVLRAAAKGTFTLKPRIMYLDETGKYKSHEPEPVTITVKELGIKGWIKGER